MFSYVGNQIIPDTSGGGHFDLLHVNETGQAVLGDYDSARFKYNYALWDSGAQLTLAAQKVFALGDDGTVFGADIATPPLSGQPAGALSPFLSSVTDGTKTSLTTLLPAEFRKQVSITDYTAAQINSVGDILFNTATLTGPEDAPAWTYKTILWTRQTSTNNPNGTLAQVPSPGLQLNANRLMVDKKLKYPLNATTGQPDETLTPYTAAVLKVPVEILDHSGALATAIPTVASSLLNSKARGPSSILTQPAIASRYRLQVEFSSQLSASAEDTVIVTYEDGYSRHLLQGAFKETGNNSYQFSYAGDLLLPENPILLLNGISAGSDLPGVLSASFDPKEDELPVLTNLQLDREGTSNKYLSAAPNLPNEFTVFEGGDPSPELPVESTWRVRVATNPFNNSDQFELAVWGKLDSDGPNHANRALGKIKLTRQNDGCFSSKPIFCIRQYDKLTAAARTQWENNYELVIGEGSLVEIIGIGAIIGVTWNVADYLKDEILLSMVNKWDQKDAHTQIF